MLFILSNTIFELLINESKIIDIKDPYDKEVIRLNSEPKTITRLWEIANIINLITYHLEQPSINLNSLSFELTADLFAKSYENLNKNILKSKTHKFDIDGKYLMDIGMEQGALMGKVLKKIEEEWIKNNFKITKDQIKEIVKSNSN